MNTLETLRKTREHLTDPANWCGSGAAAAGGSFCIAVTLSHISNETWAEPHQIVARLICDDSHGALGVHDWNDNPATTHADVLALLDRAIVYQEARAEEFNCEPVREVERV